jgi:hypothetical protein
MTNDRPADTIGIAIFEVSPSLRMNVWITGDVVFTEWPGLASTSR